MPRPRVLIVGTGLAGATAARILAEQGYDILALERQSHPAGLCHDERNADGLIIHNHGPHCFHTSCARVWEFLSRFTDWHPFELRVLSSVDGRLVPFPICLQTVNGLFGTCLDAAGFARFLNEEVLSSRFEAPARNFRDAVVSRVGERLYKVFYKGYSEKQWGRPPEKISAEVAERVPVRLDGETRYFTDTWQGMPVEGYTKMIERMLDHHRISVRFGVDYFNFREILDPALVVYTGELDRFFEYAFDELEYRSLKLRFETLEKEFFQPVSVVNYPNDHEWTRITEFKHFTDHQSPRTTVCYEYPIASGNPYYVVMTRENIQKRELYMKEASRLEASGSVLFVGRLGEYRYYNMDQAVESAMEKTWSWLERFGS